MVLVRVQCVIFYRITLCIYTHYMYIIHKHVYIYIYIHICLYKYVCMYMYIYIYIYTHIHMYIERPQLRSIALLLRSRSLPRCAPCLASPYVYAHACIHIYIYIYIYTPQRCYMLYVTCYMLYYITPPSLKTDFGQNKSIETHKYIQWMYELYRTYRFLPHYAPCLASPFSQDWFRGNKT